MGRILLVRHGQTEHNRDEVIQGPRIDSELSDVGRRQAASLAQALALRDIGSLYTSPLRRARETAQAVARPHGAAGLAVQVVPEMYELDYGLLIGRSYREAAQEMEQVLDAWRMGFVQEPFPGGESAVLAQHRIRPFATRLLEQGRDRDLAVVGHGRINRILACTLTGAGLTRLEEFPQSNAAITELAVGDGGVEVVRRNDTSHLDLATDAFS